MFPLLDQPDFEFTSLRIIYQDNQGESGVKQGKSKRE